MVPLVFEGARKGRVIAKALLTWVWFKPSSALQSHKWQLIGVH